jgi:hypothetical protein
MCHITHNWSLSNHVRCTTSHTINSSTIVREVSHRTRLTCSAPCGKNEGPLQPILPNHILSMVYIWTTSATTTPVDNRLTSFRSATWNITWPAKRKQDLVVWEAFVVAMPMTSPVALHQLAHESPCGRTPVILAHHRPQPWPTPAAWSPWRMYTYVPNFYLLCMVQIYCMCCILMRFTGCMSKIWTDMVCVCRFYICRKWLPTLYTCVRYIVFVTIYVHIWDKLICAYVLDSLYSWPDLCIFNENYRIYMLHHVFEVV